MALAWLLHQPGVTGPIIGPRTMEQSKGRCAPWTSSSTRPRLRASTSSSPAHKPAPEDYAW